MTSNCFPDPDLNGINYQPSLGELNSHYFHIRHKDPSVFAFQISCSYLEAESNQRMKSDQPKIKQHVLSCEQSDS